MALEREQETYRLKFPELHPHEGKFVLIHGDLIAGIYPTLEEALGQGYERFGLEPFMAREIVEVEQPKCFSRNIARCPS